MSSGLHKKPPHPVDVHVGKQLRLRRKALGLSQADLGRQVGITFQQIQKYERGTNRMGASRLWEFAQVLQVPVDYFFQGYESNGSKATLPPDSVFLESRETQSLVRYYHNIADSKLRKAIVGLIRAIADDATEINL